MYMILTAAGGIEIWAPVPCCAQVFTGVVGKFMIEPPRDLDADAGSRPAESHCVVIE